MWVDMYVAEATCALTALHACLHFVEIVTISP